MAALGQITRILAAAPTRAAALDDAASYPAQDMAELAKAGLPLAPLPVSLGGEGAGTDPGAARIIFDLLRALGRANLALGRLFEAHVNAARLILRYGTPAQAEALATWCREGCFLGLWVTDPPGRPLVLEGRTLSGAKGPSSGAGHARHALVTVADGAATRLAVLDLTGEEPVTDLSPRLHGMRSAANGIVTLDGLALPPDRLIGADGDYLREPDFSTGAWRTMAVTLGGLEALVEHTRATLVARGHHTAPMQQARFGEMMIALETARHFTWAAAEAAEHGTLPIPDQVATVNLARIAAEAATLEAMRHAQRGLGLGALVRPNPAERLLRDLATYLRQPAPDAVLTEAGAFYLGP